MEQSADIGNMLIPNMNFITQSVPNTSKSYHLGTKQESPLSFDLNFYSEEPIYAYKREQIASWLSGDGTYKKLQIIQEDMISIYYNCYFSKLDWNSIRNVGYGFTGTVVCDAPYAWRLPLQFKKINQPTGYINGVATYPEHINFAINNTSTDYLPIIPDVLIHLADNNNSVRVTNMSNKERYFEFKELRNGEIISINNLLVIESINNPNSLIIDNFEGDFLRLVKGKNLITVDGQIKSIFIKYQLSRKIGG